jgi:ribosomal protein L37AE/L43A
MTEKQKYRITVRCGCGNEFKKITQDSRFTQLDDDDPVLQKLLSKVKCPDCKKADGERRFRLGDGAVSDNDIVDVPAIVAIHNYSCDSCSKTTRFYLEKLDDKLGHCQHCGSQDIKYIGHAATGVVSQNSQNMIKALDMTAKMTMDTYKINDLNMNSNMKPGDTCAPKLPPTQQRLADSMFDHSKSPMNINFNQIGKKALAGAYADPNNAVARLHRSKAAPKFDLINAPPVNVRQGSKTSTYDSMLRKH